MKFVALLLLPACAAPSYQQAPHDLPYQRVPAPTLHRPPRIQPAYDWWPALTETTVRPLAESLNPGYWIEKVLGGAPALDINHFGQVLESPWFTPRLGRYPFTPQMMAQGPNQGEGPAPGPLLVIGGKVQGATPGLVVKDSAGIEYIVKFDPPAFPGLASGAEAISTKILYAAGYFVPENHVLTFELSRLRMDPNALTADDRGDPVAFTQERLDTILAHINPFPGGTARALFSRVLPGKILGPFYYRGQRADDPNDDVPHERRRSLRGLWLFSAWLNNVDTRASNTLDVFIPGEDPELGYIRHYLIDFGDALGSGGTRPKYLGEGYEGRIDWRWIASGFFSAGIYYRYWLPLRRAPFRSVGIFEAEVFEPGRWAPSVPNPAFDSATVLDTYWAGSIIARFTRPHLEAVVAAANYKEPGARSWVLEVLRERQRKVIQYAFARVLPLDDPKLSDTTLSLVDLARASGLYPQTEAGYQWEVFWEDHRLGGGLLRQPELDLGPFWRAATTRTGFSETPFLQVRWTAEAGGPSVTVHIRALENQLLLVGLERTVN